MNTLRTLPILNRPSRPSSPAPASTQVTTASVPGTTTQPPLIALDPKPRSRSLSRQVADKVSSLQLSGTPANGNGAVITHSQPLGSKKGPSPPDSRPATPRMAQTPLPTPGPENVVPQGGGYMDVLGSRFNETVNKASAGVDFKAKKGFKKGAGWGVGEAVVKYVTRIAPRHELIARRELPFPPSDAYLIRAVLRTAVRSLSIYITRLESLLFPALTDPAFGLPLNLVSTSTHAHPLNPVQYFALSIGHAAWESCEVLEEMIETGTWPRFLQETLRPVMDKLDLIVGKVIQPLLGGLKRDLIGSLARTEGTSPSGGKIIGLATVPAPASNIPVAREHSNQPLSRLSKEPSQGGTSRQLAIPVTLQHFASRVDMSRKVLEIVAGPCQDDGEGWVTGVVVAVVWKGMCVVSEKDQGATDPRPPSPGSVSKALRDIGKESEAAPAVVASPALSGVTAKFTTMLPSRAQSRAPSPPRSINRYDPMTHYLFSFESLVKRLVNNLVPPPSTTAPIDPKSTEHLAREALHEALEALESFRIVSIAINFPNASARLLSAMRRLRDDIDDISEEALDDALEDMPAVTLFTMLLRRANASLPQERLKTPAELFGYTSAEFERQVLSGFGAAEEWERRVALALRPEVERVLSAMVGEIGEKPGKEVMEAIEWVRCLGVAGEARAAVKSVGAT